MVESSEHAGKPGARPEKAARQLPTAALAAAVILVALTGFALYRRHAAPPGEEEPPVSSAPTEVSSAAPAEVAPTPGGMIVAMSPIRLTPEASILSERYRCVCGCNDALSVCTCQNKPGSEEMKRFLQALVDDRKPPEEIDRAMAERFGAACLLSNPAPPPTLPSHAGKPPAGGAEPR